MKIEMKMDDEDMKALLDNVHDRYYDLTGESLEHHKTLLIAGQLPPSTLLKAIQWGGGDTEVREEIGEWLKERVNE